MKGYRTGLGFDIHRFERGRDLYLGGVKIDFESGLAGHSDADCVIHSVCDAILGALSMGDIGKLFPDTDPEFKDKRSTHFLLKMKSVLSQKRATVVNIDCMIMAERPKIAPYSKRMAGEMSKHLGISADRINIKAGTMEGLGALGRKEGIACLSTVLLAGKK